MSASLQLKPLDFELVKDEYTDRWDRADTDSAVIDVHAPGHFTIRLTDGGDEHETLIGERGEDTYYGYCDCDGFKFHTEDNKGPCAHLCVLGKLTVFDEVPIPDVDDLERGDQDDRPNEGDGDRDDHGADQTDQDLEDQDVDADARRESVDEHDQNVSTDPSGDGGVDIEVPDRDPSEIETVDEFVSEIAGVPPAFVVDMGNDQNPSPYVTKEGLNFLAYQEDLEVQAEEISPSWEEPNDVAAWRGIVKGPDGQTWSDIGTAHRDQEDMQGADTNLDELASTRATNRALRLATGCGLASLAEIEGDSVVQESRRDVQEDDVDDGPDVIDAEAEVVGDFFNCFSVAS